MANNKSIIFLGTFIVLMFGLLPNQALAVGGGHEQVLHSFCVEGGNCADGASPRGPLVSDAAGHLYGTTYLGGVFNNNCGVGYGGDCGTVFELIRQADGTWREKLLHTFEYDQQDGTNPDAGLIFDAEGNLYGTTVAGGTGGCIVNASLVGCGTVFELSPRADGEWTYTVLHNFSLDGDDGYYPYAGLTLGNDGNLYGTTFNGGSNCVADWGCGTVFEM
jgi:hypothetical protein